MEFFFREAADWGIHNKFEEFQQNSTAIWFLRKSYIEDEVFLATTEIIHEQFRQEKLDGCGILQNFLQEFRGLLPF